MVRRQPSRTVLDRLGFPALHIRHRPFPLLQLRFLVDVCTRSSKSQDSALHRHNVGYNTVWVSSPRMQSLSQRGVVLMSRCDHRFNLALLFHYSTSQNRDTNTLNSNTIPDCFMTTFVGIEGALVQVFLSLRASKVSYYFHTTFATTFPTKLRRPAALHQDGIPSDIPHFNVSRHSIWPRRLHCLPHPEFYRARTPN
jgi:hypothetical protein